MAQFVFLANIGPKWPIPTCCLLMHPFPRGPITSLVRPVLHSLHLWQVLDLVHQFTHHSEKRESTSIRQQVLISRGRHLGFLFSPFRVSVYFSTGRNIRYRALSLTPFLPRPASLGGLNRGGHSRGGAARELREGGGMSHRCVPKNLQPKMGVLAIGIALPTALCGLERAVQVKQLANTPASYCGSFPQGHGCNSYGSLQGTSRSATLQPPTLLTLWSIWSFLVLLGHVGSLGRWGRLGVIFDHYGPCLATFWLILVIFGLFWSCLVILGHLGSFLVTLGHLGSNWAILGHFGQFGTFWVILGHFCHFGSFWVMLGHFGHLGSFWVICVSFWIIWVPLGHLAPLWVNFGSSMVTLGHFVSFGHFGHFGHSSPNLVSLWSFWVILGHFQSFLAVRVILAILGHFWSFGSFWSFLFIFGRFVSF